MNKNTSKWLSLEAIIDPQPKWEGYEIPLKRIINRVNGYNNFRDNLTEAEIKLAYKALGMDTEMDKLLKELSTAIKQRTNLTIVFQDGYQVDPYSMVYKFGITDRRSKERKTLKDLLLKDRDDTKPRDQVLTYRGRVDYNKVWVTGDFATVENYIVVDWIDAILVKKANAKEISWVLLHETGHVFDNALQAYKNVLTFTLLDSVHRNNLKINKVVKQATELGILTPKKAKDMTKRDYALVVTDTIEHFITDSIDDQLMANSEEDEVNADAFANHMGYGLYAGSALVKFTDLRKDNNEFSTGGLVKLATEITLLRRAKYEKATSSILGRIKSFLFGPEEVIKGFKSYRDFSERMLDAKVAILDRLDKIVNKVDEAILEPKVVKEVKKNLKAIKTYEKFLKKVDGAKASKWDLWIHSGTTDKVEEAYEIKQYQNALLGLAANNTRVSSIELKLLRNKLNKK